MTRSHPLAAVLAVQLLTAVAQPQAWTQPSPANAPSARLVDGGSTYDSGRGKVLVFGGGVAPPNFFNDTWEWDGNDWTEVFPATSPPARVNHAMAFDSVRGVTVLFGGRGRIAGSLSGTWEWDGVDWSEKFPSTKPSDRIQHSLVFDDPRKVILLFGGITSAGVNAETWEWDGTTWTQRFPATSPSKRSSARAVYDSARHCVVLFGGKANTTGGFNDTWEWDGNNWTERHPSNRPPARYAHGMVYNEDLGATVLFGGLTGTTGFFSDTWAWDGTNWTDITPAVTPSGRSSPAFVYDAARRQSVLFGGSTGPGFTDETWVHGVPTPPASYSSFGVGCGQPQVLLSNVQLPQLGGSFQILLQNLPTFRAGAVVIGSSNTTWSGTNLPFDLSFLGGTGCTLYVSGEVVVPFGTLSQTTLAWGVAIPSEAALAGVQFYNQGLVVDPAAVLASNAGVATIGY